MSANKINKLDSLKATLDSLNEKINSLMAKKRTVEKQIKDTEEKEFMQIIRNNNYTVVDLSNDIKLIKVIKENNLSQQDLLEFLGGSNHEN